MKRWLTKVLLQNAEQLWEEGQHETYTVDAAEHHSEVNEARKTLTDSTLDWSAWKLYRKDG